MASKNFFSQAYLVKRVTYEELEIQSRVLSPSHKSII